MIQDLNEISDGRIYGIKDMVRTAPHDCEGCHSCCEGMGDTIVLDPLDAGRLTQGTGMDFDSLLKGTAALGVVDGLILPHLNMTGQKEACVFLNEQGRCKIHAFRPGLCRTFPLGRLYEEEQVSYFRQKHVCGAENGSRLPCSKIKVGKWLDTPDLKNYHQFLVRWHSFRRRAEAYLQKEPDEKMGRALNLFVLNQFYRQPFDSEKCFYSQFWDRLNRAEHTFWASARH